MRPHMVLVFDLTFLTPKGLHGEIGLLSAICVYTRFVWLRPIWGEMARDCAYALFAVICDTGVVPLKLLSDRDQAFRE